MADITTNGCKTNMDSPTIQPKFLPKPDELGLVAVGFSGGQVCKQIFERVAFV